MGLSDIHRRSWEDEAYLTWSKSSLPRALGGGGDGALKRKLPLASMRPVTHLRPHALAE